MNQENKYHIHKEEPISDEEIRATKDFKKLTYEYQKMTKPLVKTPLYKRHYRKILMTIILIAIVIWLIIEFG